jgi:phage FluMu protein Com
MIYLIILLQILCLTASEKSEKINKIKEFTKHGTYSIIYDMYKKKKDLNVNIPKQGRTYGKLDAKHSIKIFMDYACPMCKVSINELKKRVDENKGKLSVTYILYPLDEKCNTNLKGSFSKFSCFSAKVALCSLRKNKLIEATDLLFKLSPGRKIFNQDNIIDRVSLELNIKDLRKCYMSTWSSEALKLENSFYKDRLKANGTPVVFLNNKKIGRIYKDKKMFNNFLKYIDYKANK